MLIFRVGMVCALGAATGSLSKTWAREIDEDRSAAFYLLTHPSWPVERGHGFVRIRIEDGPEGRAAITVTRHDEPAILPEELTPSALQRVFGYADGFRFGRIRLGRRTVVHVLGHPQGHPDEVLSDYFFLHHGRIFRISCVVSPAQAYLHYRSLFRKIVRSFRFADDPDP